MLFRSGISTWLRTVADILGDSAYERNKYREGWRKVSYHLSQLKKAGLIFESREKNYIYYSLNASVLEEVLLWLQDLKGEGKK